MKSSKATGIALFGLYSVIGLAIAAGFKTANAKNRGITAGRLQKDGLFYYYEIGQTPESDLPFALYVSDGFEELPPESRDDATAMALISPLESEDAAQSFLLEYADALV